MRPSGSRHGSAPPDVQRVGLEHPLASLSVIIAARGSIAAFVIGMRRSLRDPEPPLPPLQRPDGVDRSEP
jgi:hypothetical protein